MEKSLSTSRLSASQARNVTGDLGNTWKRRERKVVGATNRPEHAQTLQASAADIKAKAARTAARKAHTTANQQYFEKTTILAAENLMDERIKKINGAEAVQNGVQVKPSDPAPYFAENRPLRAVDKSLIHSIKDGQAGGRVMKPQERERGPPNHIPRGDGPAPEFAESLAGATRLGNTKYMDSSALVQAMQDPSCPGYAGPSERFRSSALDKFDTRDEKALASRRDDFRLQRRRDNEARVMQTYANEEAEKLLAQDNRALARAHQRLKYFERVYQVEKYRTGNNKKPDPLPDQLNISGPQPRADGDTLDHWASQSLGSNSNSSSQQPTPASSKRSHSASPRSNHSHLSGGSHHSGRQAQQARLQQLFQPAGSLPGGSGAGSVMGTPASSNHSGGGSSQMRGLLA